MFRQKDTFDMGKPATHIGVIYAKPKSPYRNVSWPRVPWIRRVETTVLLGPRMMGYKNIIEKIKSLRIAEPEFLFRFQIFDSGVAIPNLIEEDEMRDMPYYA